MLERSIYWRTMRVTAWVLRFIRNCKARSKSKKMSGSLVTDEITTTSGYWVKQVQKAEETCLKSPEWKLVKDDCTGVLKCELKAELKDIGRFTFLVVYLRRSLSFTSTNRSCILVS